MSPRLAARAVHVAPAAFGGAAGAGADAMEISTRGGRTMHDATLEAARAAVTVTGHG